MINHAYLIKINYTDNVPYRELLLVLTNLLHYIICWTLSHIHILN